MDPLLFSTIPANAVILLPEDQRSGYLSKIIAAPEKIRDIAFSDDTGAYVRGLAKGSKIAAEDAPKIALSILEVFIGNKNIAELSTLIAQQTGISLDEALKVASEIDQDLFAPIQSELNVFWALQSAPKPATPVASPAKEADALPRQPERRPQTPIRTPNVLDLKELPARPEQKDLPSRPIQKTLMPGSRTVDLKNTPPKAAAPQPRPTPPTPPLPVPRQFPLPPTHRP